MARYFERGGSRTPQPKPCTVRNLPQNILRDICLMLDPHLHGKDYRALAGELGYSYYEVRSLDRKSEPTATLLEQWWSNKENCTVTELIGLLKKIQRHDVIAELKRYEYFVPSRPVSSSSYKEATENDIQSFIEDRLPSENDLSALSSSAQSLNLSDASSRLCSDSLSPSDIDIDTDEELDLKIQRESGPSLSSTLHRAQLHHNPAEETPGTRRASLGRPSTRNLLSSRPVQAPGTRRSSLGRPASMSLLSYHPVQGPGTRPVSLGRPSSMNLLSSHPSQGISPTEGAVAPSFSHVSLDAVAGTTFSSRTHSTSHLFSSLPTLGASAAGGERASFVRPWSGHLHGPSLIQASDKVALVIGNQNYTKFAASSGLLYPHRDAYDVAKALCELGFKVVSLVDVTLAEFRTVMLAFCRLLGEGVYAVFYFAGHGFEECDGNYLMPVDASADRKPDECLAAQELLQEMRLANTTLNLLILDTCRMRSPRSSASFLPTCLLSRKNFGNTIIAYSCSSHERAYESVHQRNGVYATELLKRIRDDMRIELILMAINEAVYGNPFVRQRPVFESDAILDCRLTCPIDAEKYRRLVDLNPSYGWWSPMFLPPCMECEKSEEGVQIRLDFECLFSNVLEVHIYLLNKNRCEIRDLHTDIFVTSELERHRCPVMTVVPADGRQHKVCECRIFGLQKLKDPLLCVVQGRFKLLQEDVLFEVKLNLAYPLISKYLKDFQDWVSQ